MSHKEKSTTAFEFETTESAEADLEHFEITLLNRKKQILDKMVEKMIDALDITETVPEKKSVLKKWNFIGKPTKTQK